MYIVKIPKNPYQPRDRHFLNKGDGDKYFIGIEELDHMEQIAGCQAEEYQGGLYLGLGVDKPHRGCGLAQLLIAGAAMINPMIYLSVSSDNHDARSAYRRVGLQQVNDKGYGIIHMEGRLDVEQILSHVRSKGTQFIIEKLGD